MRIVSLLPAATEIVALLGAGEQLVGITHECDFPAFASARTCVTSSAIPHSENPAEIDAAVREQSSEGHALFSMDDALIATLRPTLLLTQELCDVCAVRESDVRTLACTLPDSPPVITLGGTTIDGIFADIQLVADALGNSQLGEDVVASLRHRLLNIHETLKAERAPRPRVALVEWTSPVFIAGHWGPEQIRSAGGRDVLGTAGAHSVTVPMAALKEAEAEIVLVAPCGYNLARAKSEAEQLLHQSDWAWLNGKQVWALDANSVVSRPGPRVIDGVETMARIFNPGLFSSLDASIGVRVA